MAAHRHATAALSSGETALQNYVTTANKHNTAFYEQLDRASSQVLQSVAGAADYLAAAEEQRRLASPPQDDE